MKRSYKSILYLCMVVGLIGVGCSKDSFNINSNPNSPTDSTVSYDVLLPAALDGTGRVIASDWGWLQNWMGYWARSSSYAPSVNEETYNVTSNFSTFVWTDLYDNLYDYNVMQGRAEQAGAEFYAGIARIMKAVDFQMLVDIYGNVPYHDALKGAANITPTYESGVEIYKDLFRQIDTGLNLITGADIDKNAYIASNDLLFGADKVKWAQFANTLKLRMLIHCYAITDINITGELAIITANGNGFLTTDATINPGYSDSKPSPFWETYYQSNAGTTQANFNYYRANSWAVIYYGFDGDPRRPAFYNGTSGAEYGAPSADISANAATLATGTGLLKAASQDQWILTAAESYLLQSEAQLRGWIDGDAGESLRSGVITSLSFLGIEDPELNADDYIGYNAGYPDVDITAPSEMLDGGYYAVLSQKMFALNGINTLEVWTDYRRTDIAYGADPAIGYNPGPPLSVSPQLPPSITHIPIRLIYPQSEYNYNSKNVPAPPNAFSDRIFWDVE